jgi:hypothetical protein
MPNRVEGAAPGVQPATARTDAAGTTQRQQAAQPAEPVTGGANPTDRVEISQAAQTRNREMQSANAASAGDRGAAMNAPGAQEAPQAGEQGNIDRMREQNAEQLRESEQATQQQAAQEPPQQQQGTGRLVDITG